MFGSDPQQEQQEQVDTHSDGLKQGPMARQHVTHWGVTPCEREEAAESVPVTGSANKTLKAGQAGAQGVPLELLCKHQQSKRRHLFCYTPTLFLKKRPAFLPVNCSPYFSIKIYGDLLKVMKAAGKYEKGLASPKLCKSLKPQIKQEYHNFLLERTPLPLELYRHTGHEAT